VLAEMEVLKKGNRLSVQPVTKEQWNAILQLATIDDPLAAVPPERRKQ
jgi:predicted RNA-binding protein with PUA-like domain